MLHRFLLSSGLILLTLFL